MTLKKAIQILENVEGQLYDAKMCNYTKAGDKAFNDLVEAVQIVLKELNNK
jgi:hypothetical protein